jgi:hypothetical protein
MIEVIVPRMDGYIHPSTDPDPDAMAWGLVVDMIRDAHDGRPVDVRKFRKVLTLLGLDSAAVLRLVMPDGSVVDVPECMP